MEVYFIIRPRAQSKVSKSLKSTGRSYAVSWQRNQKTRVAASFFCRGFSLLLYIQNESFPAGRKAKVLLIMSSASGFPACFLCRRLCSSSTFTFTTTFISHILGHSIGELHKQYSFTWWLMEFMWTLSRHGNTSLLSMYEITYIEAAIDEFLKYFTHEAENGCGSFM